MQKVLLLKGLLLSAVVLLASCSGKKELTSDELISLIAKEKGYHVAQIRSLAVQKCYSAKDGTDCNNLSNDLLRPFYQEMYDQIIKK